MNSGAERATLLLVVLRQEPESSKRFRGVFNPESQPYLLLRVVMFSREGCVFQKRDRLNQIKDHSY